MRVRVGVRVRVRVRVRVSTALMETSPAAAPESMPPVAAARASRQTAITGTKVESSARRPTRSMRYLRVRVPHRGQLC